MSTVYRRLTAAAAGVAAGVTVFATAAGAAPDPRVQPVPPGAVAEAHAVSRQRSTIHSLTRFFATEPGRHPAAAGAPTVADTTVPVYELRPGFVRDGTGPVARRTVLATAARASDGRTASVWAAPDGHGGWRVVNIASGTDETRYAAKAGAGVAFHEPQTDAWYALRGDTVRPLNAAARREVGTGGTSLSGYQRAVHHRYADRMPGSRYAREGLAGGAAPTADPGTGTPMPAVAGGLAGILAFAGAGLLIRRRLRSA